ncbi:hypothetical protein KS4_23990 [Poriferisphaera corsica]|uniref:Uncharacterized protein n=1 Tax=Poriferisphaera corsica TaxID=2528020 RepID=A0A517YVR2_9BACT|nr:hypothetical protein [Poriferisphaera corsica]QDU34331.1 hypothetical protein KS4_23990 [Poriferisphaera corsica]
MEELVKRRAKEIISDLCEVEVTKVTDNDACSLKCAVIVAEYAKYLESVIEAEKNCASLEEKGYVKCVIRNGEREYKMTEAGRIANPKSPNTQN